MPSRQRLTFRAYSPEFISKDSIFDSQLKQSSDSVAGTLLRDFQEGFNRHLLLNKKEVKFRNYTHLNKENYTSRSETAKTLKVAWTRKEGNRSQAATCPQVTVRAHHFRTLANAAGQKPTPAKWLHLSC